VEVIGFVLVFDSLILGLVRGISWPHYALVIFLSCRYDAFDRVYDLLSLHLESNGFILFLPVDYVDLNDVFIHFGLRLFHAWGSVASASTDLIFEDIATQGVYVVGVIIVL